MRSHFVTISKKVCSIFEMFFLQHKNQKMRFSKKSNISKKIKIWIFFDFEKYFFDVVFFFKFWFARFFGKPHFLIFLLKKKNLKNGANFFTYGHKMWSHFFVLQYFFLNPKAHEAHDRCASKTPKLIAIGSKLAEIAKKNLGVGY